jgi:hypothetical protein
LLVLALVVGCGASARQTTLEATLTALDGASAAFVSYDKAHQEPIVSNAPDKATATTQIAAYRVEQAKILTALTVAYQALAKAWSLNDSPSLSSAIAAAAALAALLHTKGIVP